MFENLVSVFTPTYQTPLNVLYRTYKSICSQSHPSWEWVVYHDSGSDKTWNELIKIAKKDERVRIYRSHERTGNIGANKRACAGLSWGEFLVELDHDDELTPDCLKVLVQAFRKFPDAGFAYSHFSEVQGDKCRDHYEDNWGWGYGAYRKEKFQGRVYDVVISASINSKTIRHIVSAPNHVRAWRAKTYFEIGGHNPDLPVADDYELMVRTFLKTRMIRVNHFGYLQHFHDKNSQTPVLGKIQACVRNIRETYEHMIAARFQELQVPDFAKADQEIIWGNVGLTPHTCQYDYSEQEPPKLAVVTPCIRPENIQAIHNSLGNIPVHWIIVEDIDKTGLNRVCPPVNSIHKISVLCFSDKSISHAGGQCCKNRGLEYVLKISKEPWIYFLDDDNLMFPHLSEWLHQYQTSESPPMLVFWQLSSDGSVRKTETVKVRLIDQAQYMVRTDRLGDLRFPLTYDGDGQFAEAYAKEHGYYKLPVILSFYNRIGWKLPG